MKKLNFENPKENLLNAPLYIKNAMNDFIDYYDEETKLRADIQERFNYPSLWAAIDRLLEYREERIVALMKLKAAGYTTDDAFMFSEYEKEND